VGIYLAVKLRDLPVGLAGYWNVTAVRFRLGFHPARKNSKWKPDQATQYEGIACYCLQLQ
jgi:hypothetical protein